MMINRMVLMLAVYLAALALAGRNSKPVAPSSQSFQTLSNCCPGTVPAETPAP